MEISAYVPSPWRNDCPVIISMLASLSIWMDWTVDDFLLSGVDGIIHTGDDVERVEGM